MDNKIDDEDHKQNNKTPRYHQSSEPIEKKNPLHLLTPWLHHQQAPNSWLVTAQKLPEKVFIAKSLEN